MKDNVVQKLRENIIVSVILVSLSLLVILIPFSLFIGWNLLTAILFWFILVPIIANQSSRFHSKIKKQLIVAISDCILFYLFMIFMIYYHYKSDFFKLMITSIFSSILMVWLLYKINIITTSE